ncbi:MAG TPA: GNAT family N-acetyltransferase [Gaiellaceae bacterium]|nr:GNAT family N-acetyltransferase [Gaiellaceae bacterium]
MTVERVTAVDDALVEAFALLVPQVSSRPAPNRADLETLLADPKTIQLVARNGNEIAGALTLVVYRTPTGLTSVIEDVVVDQAARGRGLGEALVEEAKAQAVAAGATRISLTSRPEREAANRLYPRLGFEQKQTNVYVWRPG